jgi:5-methylcytosine-specific restriction endonuclease McrA
MARPSNWYELALQVDVMNDLEKHPDINKKLGSYRRKFINWCAIQRVQYEADIEEEYIEFEETIMKKRLYNRDVKLWKKISKQVFKRDKYTCKYCNQKGGILEVDHIIPISKGGSNHLSNLTTSCRKCNRQKKDKTVEEFVKWKKRKGDDPD